MQAFLYWKYFRDWDGMEWGGNQHTQPYLFLLSVMLRADVGNVIWALNMGIPCGSHSKFSLFFETNGFHLLQMYWTCHMYLCILFTVLTAWDRTWEKLLRLQDLKIGTMVKIGFAFFFLNKKIPVLYLLIWQPSSLLSSLLLHYGPEEILAVSSSLV